MSNLKSKPIYNRWYYLFNSWMIKLTVSQKENNFAKADGTGIGLTIFGQK